MWAWDSVAGGWAWMGVMHLLWWVLLIVVVAAVFRWATNSRAGAGDRPLEILRERFARGEIDKGEYDDRLRHLRGG
ncbi:SHOCT domain-containing protein [Ramlibacter sp. HM2]|uniref:SHOCT domain-containing protein n=2 Tax=Ramlibacter pallidus TaxID=2780087 RepID=A0ABR9RXR7_9BURK|nr:SHOCT domain-containing protein [Ramlibacter pallidus]